MEKEGSRNNITSGRIRVYADLAFWKKNGKLSFETIKDTYTVENGSTS